MELNPKPAEVPEQKVDPARRPLSYSLLAVVVRSRNLRFAVDTAHWPAWIAVSDSGNVTRLPADYQAWANAIDAARMPQQWEGASALMDAGEPRPAHRWTTLARIDLDRLATQVPHDFLERLRLGPVYQTLADGRNYGNEALSSLLGPRFDSLVEALKTRAEELRAVRAMTDQRMVLRNVPAAQGAKRDRMERKFAWLAKAMLIVQAHPERPDCDIARDSGIHGSRLSRSRQYQAAAALARQGRIPDGSMEKRKQGVRGGSAAPVLEARGDAPHFNQRGSRQNSDEEAVDRQIDRDTSLRAGARPQSGPQSAG